MKIAVVIFALLLALLSGTALALFSWRALTVVFPLLLALLVARDYRIGVALVAMTLAIVSSQFLPSAGGRNPIPYAIALSLAVLLLKRAFKPHELVFPPRVLLACLVVPLCVGAYLALPHLMEGLRNYPSSGEAESLYERGNYLRNLLIMPLLYAVFSVLTANAVRDSARPEGFVTLMGVATLLPAAAIIALVMFIGVGLDTLQSKRSFLGGLGMHANEFGKLLAFAFGPMLYVTFATQGARRLFFAVVTAAALTAILLTFTRAAYVAIAIVTLMFLFQSKRPGLVVAMAIAGAAATLVAPSAFIDRITTGINESAFETARAGSLTDKLTAGRIGGYELLAPEVLHSPLWGSGTGSTAWSAAVTQGLYRPQHPHNLYLEAALDLGMIGLALTLYFYHRLHDAMKRLAARADFSAEMQAFFRGSRAGFVGILILSMAGGHWYPHPEQALMWLAFGITFAYWPWVEAQRAFERPRLTTSGGLGMPQPPPGLDRRNLYE
jgi:O-antigen ligase